MITHFAIPIDCIDNHKEENIGKENNWRRPRNTINRTMRKWPQKRSWEKLIRMSEHIEENMKWPCHHHPPWLLANIPGKYKEDRKYNKTMGNVIHGMNVFWNLSKFWTTESTIFKTKQSSDREDAK